MNNFKTYFTEEYKTQIEVIKERITQTPYNFKWIYEGKDVEFRKPQVVATRPITCDSIDPNDSTRFEVWVEDMGPHHEISIFYPKVVWHRWPDLLDFENNQIFTIDMEGNMRTRDITPSHADSYKAFIQYDIYNSWKDEKEVKLMKMIMLLEPTYREKWNWTPKKQEALSALKLKYLGSDQITPQDWVNAI